MWRLLCALEHHHGNECLRAKCGGRVDRHGSPKTFLVCVALLSVLTLASCQEHASSEEPSIGVAYAGPATLSLRKELSSRSAASIAVPHGEELQILETRRRFVRVRTSSGVEGWTDENLLLSAQQMDALRRLSVRTAQLPSEGSATAVDTLNVHTEAARSSPSFYQIAENGSVEVVGHSITPRQAQPATSLNIARPNTAKKAKSKLTKTTPLISAPPRPGPPANWREISRPRAKDLPGYVVPVAAAVPTDDWSLVRTKDGRAGWVLSRMLYMSVPDDIAKYAEGHRVTAYLILGDVKDGDEVKHNYLWTTVASGNKCCEFDSFRVFVWSTKRHRYETAFVERNVAGFYPVELAQIPSGDDSGFSLRVEDKDGTLYKRTYAFTGYHVRLVSREPVAAAATAAEEPRASVPAAPAYAAPSVWAQMTDRVKRLWRGTRD
jgi:uncharacterized protein YgiM (DUF1202 family)